MKLLVMSDTHGDAEVIERVKGYHKDVDAVIHCGDSELPYDHPHLEGMERVAGNCDSDKNYLDEILFRIGDVLIYVTHGHLYDVKSSPMKLMYRSQEVGANIVCFGHSHIIAAEYLNDTLFLNPGSLLKPRGIVEKSFMVVTISNTHYVIDCYRDDNFLFEQVVIER